MAFTSMLPPTEKRPPSQKFRAGTWARTSGALSDHYSFTLWLLIGGSLQAILALTFRRSIIYVCVPVLILLAVRSLDTLAIMLKFKPNPYLSDAIFHRVAPQIPDDDGNFGGGAASPSNKQGGGGGATAGGEKVVVFLLGFKINHPAGILAPELGAINDANVGMWKELAATAPESGYYGSSDWTSRDTRGAVEILTISYWRSTEDIHRFAYSAQHRAIWDHWNSLSKQRKVDHLGINHEIFEVDRHRWEAVYLNFQPTLLGATSFLKRGDKFVGGNVDDQWISGLMDARKGKLRTSAGRLGRDPAQLEDKYGRAGGGGGVDDDGRIY